MAPEREEAGRALVSAVVIGYLIADRLFAYLHVSVAGLPIYPGELAIAVGLVTIPLAAGPLPRWVDGRRFGILFLGWATLVLLLHLGANPLLDVIRDFSLIYYAAFALFAFHIPWERAGSRTFTLIAAAFIAQAMFAILVFLNALPDSAFGSLSDVIARGDVEGATLLGGAAFFLLADSRLRIPRSLRLGIASVQLLVAVVIASRAVFVALVLFVGVMMIAKRGRALRLLLLVFLTAGLLAQLVGVNFESIQFGTRNRGAVTLTTAVRRTLATVGLSSDQATIREAEGKARFRSYWWATLWKHSLERADWLLVGRGFGPSLAVEVGYAGRSDERPLRAPHSVAVDVFARLGLIGLVFWLGWMVSVGLAGYRVTGDPGYLGSMAGWLMLYWGCILVTGMFGVVLESPFGAAPFYFVTGAILRLAAIQRQTAPSEPSMPKPDLSLPRKRVAIQSLAADAS